MLPPCNAPAERESWLRKSWIFHPSFRPKPVALVKHLFVEISQ
jgi:hypothetical protein